jgi:hypothetical protein
MTSNGHGIKAGLIEDSSGRWNGQRFSSWKMWRNRDIDVTKSHGNRKQDKAQAKTCYLPFKFRILRHLGIQHNGMQGCNPHGIWRGDVQIPPPTRSLTVFTCNWEAAGLYDVNNLRNVGIYDMNVNSCVVNCESGTRCTATPLCLLLVRYEWLIWLWYDLWFSTCYRKSIANGQSEEGHCRLPFTIP